MSKDPEDANPVDVAAEIRNRLIQDLEQDKFVLYFQSIVPVASSATEEPLFREILVRFKEEEQDMMPPGMFLPVLEEQGLMPLLDRWIVSRVLKWNHGMLAAFPGRPQPRCIVNLSNDTLRRDQGFADFVARTVQKREASAESLAFEIPIMEALTAPQSVARLVSPLRSLGCGFAISGFTGEESGFDLAASLGVAFIMIDGSLIGSMSRDAGIKTKVDAIHQRCRKLGMRTVGTQVENTETLHALKSIHVDYAQGFGIDHPRVLK